jgi:predicted pyridoxine 5'-phosphate oxidase superfamily flavin-nucleotide-binding protein
MQHFLDVTVGEAAAQHQRRRGSLDNYERMVAAEAPVGLGAAEAEFLSRRDSFYLASVTEHGWPYVQHRGGPAGFVKVLDHAHLAWADRTGNRQYITAGNVDGDDRVAIIAVDYPNRTRLKLLGHARFEPEPDPATLEQLGIDGRLEGLVTVEVVAFDWNCPKYITPRYTADEVHAATEPLRARIAELEAQLKGTRPTDHR